MLFLLLGIPFLLCPTEACPCVVLSWAAPALGVPPWAMVALCPLTGETPLHLLLQRWLSFSVWLDLYPHHLLAPRVCHSAGLQGYRARKTGASQPLLGLRLVWETGQDPGPHKGGLSPVGSNMGDRQYFQEKFLSRTWGVLECFAEQVILNQGEVSPVARGFSGEATSQANGTACTKVQG